MLAAGDEPDFELFEIGHFHKKIYPAVTFPPCQGDSVR
jgi:hypothetical protein